MPSGHEQFTNKRSRRLPTFGGTVLALVTGIFLFAPGCSEDPPPTGPEQIAPVRSQFDRQQIAASPQVLDMLSRSILVDPKKLEIVSREPADTGELISIRMIGQNIPDIVRGTILVGKSFGEPREVVEVTSAGHLLLVRAVPADWSPVTDAGTLTFSVPLSAGAGERDGVKWGPWTLVRESDGKRFPMEQSGTRAPTGFDPEDISFDGFTICTGSGVTACGNFTVEVVSGHLDVAGDFNFELDLSLENIVERVKASVSESIDAGLVLDIKGSASLSVEGCVYGVCTGNVALVRSFEVGSMAGELKLGIVVGVEGGVEEINFQPGFTLTQSLEVGVEYTADDGVHGVFNADASFDPSLKVISLGNGYVKLYVGPKISAQFEILGDDNALKLEAGAYGYVKGALERPEWKPGCDNWHIGVTAGTDAKILASIDPVDINVGFTLTWPDPPVDLADFWGTGDLKIETAAYGVDPDWNGYDVSARRSAPTVTPAWEVVLEEPIGVDDAVSWQGGYCRKMPPLLFDPSGILDCDLVATEHVVEIDDIMWNCAVRGEETRFVCLEEGEENVVRYDVDCVSVFEAMCDLVNQYAAAGLIRNNGVANSLCSKLTNAGAARDRGQPRVAAHVLHALLSEIRAQTGKMIEPDAAAVMVERTHLVLSHYLDLSEGDVTTTHESL